jgi:uncharacterized protein (TIGR02246 family)
MIEDGQEIRSIIARQAEAWNRGDADGYGEACREDVGFTNILGMRWDTRAGFTARHAEMFAHAFAGSHLVIEVERLLWLDPDLAVAELMTTLTGVRAAPPGIPVAANGSLRTRLLELFVKRANRWQIAACHNTAVQEQRTSEK